MSSNRRLGRLFLAWGPDAHDYPRSHPRPDPLRQDQYEVVHSFHSFHANALNNEPDPFSSIFFGSVVKALLSGRTSVLTDQVFEDPQRRRLVEQAFRRVFPELVVEHVQLGGEPTLTDQGIVIDSDVYGEGDVCSNERIVVESDAPRELLVAALGRAAQRMMSVGEDGQEYDVEGMRDDTGEIYTPNDVSDVTVDEYGNPGFYIDCKGGIEPPMADRFRTILVEELTRGGVFSARVRVPD